MPLLKKPKKKLLTKTTSSKRLVKPAQKDRPSTGSVEVLTPRGKKLLKKEGTIALTLENMPPLPKFKETKVKRYSDKSMGKEFALVSQKDRPDHVAYKPLDKDYQFPNTYYVVERETKIPVALMTVMPDGLPVAWSGCRVCHRQTRRCICAGIAAPRSIEYIFDTITAKLAGEEWTYTHPNYTGSISGKLLLERQDVWDRRMKDVSPIQPRKPATPPARAGKRLLKKAGSSVLSKTSKRLTKKSEASPIEDNTIVAGGKIDQKELTKAANTSAKNVQDELLRRTASKPKTLRKARK